MWDLLAYLLLIVLLAAALIGAALVARSFLGGGPVLKQVMRPRRARRLDVVEHASIDGKRRLILVRRDDNEHLIMTGGPVDLVIETNILPGQRGGAPGTLQADDETAIPKLDSAARAP